MSEPTPSNGWIYSRALPSASWSQLTNRTPSLKDALQRLLNEAEIAAQVVGEAPLFDVVFSDSEVTDYRSSLKGDKGMQARFNALLLERGIFKGDGKYYGSTAHNREDVDKTIDAFASAVDALRG